jgi:hypothetical protein
MIDYKHPEITRINDGRVEVSVRIYEGEITTETEQQLDGSDIPVTRYRRHTFLGERTLPVSDLARVEDELKAMLSEEAVQRGTTPIPEQRSA